MGNDQSAEECPLCDEDLSLEEVAHRTGRVLAKTARRQNDRLEAAEAAGAAALALAERYAAGEAVAVAASEASRAEANRLRNPAHEATTRRLTEAIHRLVQESEERHATVLEDFEAKCAEADELRSENEKLKRELENARENERLAAAREAKRKRAQDAALVKAAETERLRAEVEALRREQERAATAPAEAADSRSVGYPGVEESKSETQASPDVVPQVSFDADERNSAAPLPPPSAPGGIEEVKSETRAPPYNVSRVSFDEAETGSTSVEGKTGSQASSPKPKKRSRFQKLRGWLSRRRRRATVTRPPSALEIRNARAAAREAAARDAAWAALSRSPDQYHLSEWDDFIPI